MTFAYIKSDATSANLPPNFTRFTGIGGTFFDATYRFSSSSTQYLTPDSTYHNIILDSEPNSGSNLTIYVPEAESIQTGSQFWFLFLSQSNAGDLITFLPWDPTMTINQSSSYTFTCSGQKTLLILALVPKTKNYVVHAMSAGSHMGNIIPTEIYSILTTQQINGDFIWAGLDPASRVTIIPDMSTYITPLNNDPLTTRYGFACNVSGWYRVSPNSAECNVQFSGTDGLGPHEFGLYQQSTTPFLDVNLWPVVNIDNGGNDYYGTASGGCIVYLVAETHYYFGFTITNALSITGGGNAGTISFEYLSSNGNSPTPSPAPMMMMAPPPPAPRAFEIQQPQASLSSRRSLAGQSVSALKAPAPAPSSSSRSLTRQQPPPSSKQQISSSLQDIEAVVEQYMKAKGLDLLNQVKSAEELGNLLSQSTSSSSSSSSSSRSSQPLSGRRAPRKRKQSAVDQEPVDGEELPPRSSSSSSFASSAAALEGAITALSSEPPPSKKQKKSLL